MPTPQGCDNTCEDRLYLACVQEWATCTEKINVRDNKVCMTRNILNHLFYTVVYYVSVREDVKQLKISNVMTTMGARK